MELIKTTNKEKISECLDFHKIDAYIVTELDKMAGSFVLCFPIGAQDTSINELENIEKYLLEYFTSVKIAIAGNNVVMVII